MGISDLCLRVSARAYKCVPEIRRRPILKSSILRKRSVGIERAFSTQCFFHIKYTHQSSIFCLLSVRGKCSKLIREFKIHNSLYINDISNYLFSFNIIAVVTFCTHTLSDFLFMILSTLSIQLPLFSIYFFWY